MATNQAQLVQGATDAYLQSAKNGRSVFRQKHVKTTPYTIEHTTSQPSSSAQLNQTGIVLPVPKSADFLLQSYVKITTKAVVPTFNAAASSTTYRYLDAQLSTADTGYGPYDAAYEVVAGFTSAKPGWWCAHQNELGHVAISKLRLKISGQQVMSLSSEGLAALEEIHGANGFAQRDAIGKYVSDEVRIARSTVAHSLHVRIPAWYAEHPSKALVLSAMPLNPIHYEMDTRAAADIFEVSNTNITPVIGGSEADQTAVTFKIVNVYGSVTQTERLKYTSAAQQDDIMSEWQELKWSAAAGTSSFNHKLAITGPCAGLLVFARMNLNKTGKDFFNFSSSTATEGALGADTASPIVSSALPMMPINATDVNYSQLLMSDFVTYSAGTMAPTIQDYATSSSSTSGVQFKPAQTMNVRPDILATLQLKVNGNPKFDASQEAEFFRTVTYSQQGLNAPQKPIYCIPLSVNMFSPRALGSTNFSRVEDISLEGNIDTTTVGGSTYYGAHELFVLGKAHNIANYHEGSFSKAMG